MGKAERVKLAERIDEARKCVEAAKETGDEILIATEEEFLKDFEDELDELVLWED